jgi:hypothetical protein
MTERRYSDEEAAEIFGRAARAEDPAPRALAPSEGMTLAELQAAGREAGILPEKIAEAARALAADGTRFSRKLMGITIGVGRTVELDRRLSDDEWERIVVRLRETFDARGTLRSHGSLREWTNGNLQALLEPSPSGSRLRLRTTNSAGRGLVAAGVATLAATGVVGAITAMTVGFGQPEAFMGMVGPGAAGVGLLAAALARLSGWARTRRQQMEDLAAWLLTPGSP